MGNDASRESTPHGLTDKRPMAAGRAVFAAKAARYETPSNNNDNDSDDSDDDEPRMPPPPVRGPVQATRPVTQPPASYSVRSPPVVPAHLRPKILLPSAKGLVPGDLTAALITAAWLLSVWIMGMVCAKSAMRDEPPAFTPASQWNDRRQESVEEVVVPMSNEELALRTLQYDANGAGMFEKFESQSGARVVHSTPSTPEPSTHEDEANDVIDDATDKATTAKVLQEQAPIGRRAFGARIVAPSVSVGILPGLYDAATPEADDPEIDLALHLGRAKPRRP
ncbi:hypothetical protein SPRG_02795 [Saprolegnia parasitica CBS 223.65]|uniref:Uncharacterized protein n=1 Tax=Saprolegnia parasitica (strain CBS 223.65) TaxID=695850 RepID=A0A067D0M9_SAPPC|nr:hypothetical protein SPRG_02795 [Saprolegnia parasitica CBS 223.65]KDO32316.1 hypothetical protein SPRG_02795 [Saprolegnia parasitica CBS 223.65]|eukprot:XP_012196772.1 hypothetical protein SPRG_02795 [Saprolegnia parasitica CBS 223.65]